MRRYLLHFAAPLVLVAACSTNANAGSAEIMHGSRAVEAASAVSFPWELSPALLALGATNFRISGALTASGGSGNDIEVLVLKETEFINWKNGHAVHALYSSGRVTAADVDAAIPEAGTYYTVFDNRFSSLTPKTVEGTITVSWTDAPTKSETGPSAAEYGATAMVIIAAGVAGAAIAVAVRRRRAAGAK